MDANEWADTQIELATHAFGHWDHAEVIARTQAVLSLDPSTVSLATRCKAVLLLNQSRDHRDETVDEELVTWARDSFEAYGDARMAAQANSLLSWARSRRGDRVGARLAQACAIANCATIGSMCGLSSCEHALAWICIEEGNDVAALEHVRRALEILHLAVTTDNRPQIRRLRKLEEKLSARILINRGVAPAGGENNDDCQE